MYMDFSGNTEDLVDLSAPLVTSSCGLSRPLRRPVFSTVRPHGRKDYQLLYVASGKTHFVFDGKDTVLPAGSVVFYRPHESQCYHLYASESPEVFWIHFTGSQVESFLRPLHNQTILHPGTHPEYAQICLDIIHELRFPKSYHKEVTSSLLKHLIFLIFRHAEDSFQDQNEIIRAVKYFSNNYQKNVCIEEYAKEHHMSVSKLIRGFKQYTNQTPLQYLLSARLSSARLLLEETQYNVSEISSIVGFENPLYFSRLFKKHFGISPLQYRQNYQKI